MSTMSPRFTRWPSRIDVTREFTTMSVIGWFAAVAWVGNGSTWNVFAGIR